MVKNKNLWVLCLHIFLGFCYISLAVHIAFKHFFSVTALWSKYLYRFDQKYWLLKSENQNRKAKVLDKIGNPKSPIKICQLNLTLKQEQKAVAITSLHTDIQAISCYVFLLPNFIDKWLYLIKICVKAVFNHCWLILYNLSFS